MSETVPQPPTAVETDLKLTPREQIGADFFSATDGSTGILFKAITNPNTSEEISNKIRPTVGKLTKINTWEELNKDNEEILARGIWEIKDENGNVTESGDVREVYTDVVDSLLSLPNNPDANEVGKRLAENLEVSVIEKEGQEPKLYTYPEWVAAGRPEGIKRTNEFREPPPESTTGQSIDTEKIDAVQPPKSPETGESREEFITNAKRGLEIELFTMTHGADVDFNVLPSENRKINEANPGYARAIIQKARPGVNYENIDSMTDEAVLSDRYQQNTIEGTAIELELARLGEGITAEEKQAVRRMRGELARINGEQERIKGYWTSPEPIDISRVTKMFEAGGILSNPNQIAAFLKNNEMLRNQMENFAEQNEAFKKGLAIHWKLPNGKVINITKRNLKDWGSTAGTIVGLSMFLLFLEGEKEKPQTGGGMTPH